MKQIDVYSLESPQNSDIFEPLVWYYDHKEDAVWDNRCRWDSCATMTLSDLELIFEHENKTLEDCFVTSFTIDDNIPVPEYPTFYIQKITGIK